MIESIKKVSLRFSTPAMVPHRKDCLDSFAKLAIGEETPILPRLSPERDHQESILRMEELVDPSSYLMFPSLLSPSGNNFNPRAEWLNSAKCMSGIDTVLPFLNPRTPIRRSKCLVRKKSLYSPRHKMSIKAIEKTRAPVKPLTSLDMSKVETIFGRSLLCNNGTCLKEEIQNIFKNLQN